jgi:hypothetical protein
MNVLTELLKDPPIAAAIGGYLLVLLGSFAALVLP